MVSAFGVEHGDPVAKGFRLVRTPRVPTGGRRAPGGKRPTQAQMRTQGVGTPTRTERAKAALNRIGEAQVSLKGIGATAGRGLERGSAFLESHPGTTGTALVAGGGTAGYRYASKKEPRKKS